MTTKFDAILNAAIQAQTSDIVDEIKAELDIAQAAVTKATDALTVAKQDRFDALTACKAVDASLLVGQYAENAKKSIMAAATSEATLEELKFEVDKANANLKNVCALSKQKVTPDFVDRVHRLKEDRDRMKRHEALVLNARLAYQDTVKILPQIFDGSLIVADKDDDDKKWSIRKLCSKKIGFINRDYRDLNGPDAKMAPDEWRNAANQKIRTIVMDNCGSEQPFAVLRNNLVSDDAKNLLTSWTKEIDKCVGNLYKLVQDDRQEYIKAKYPQQYEAIELAKTQRLENSLNHKAGGKKNNKSRKEVDVKPETMSGLEDIEAGWLAADNA